MNKKSILLSILILYGFNNLSAEMLKPARLVAYDSISIPGQEVILSAKLEKKVLFFRPDIKDEKLAFYIDNKNIGESITNSEGFAFLPYIINKPGIFELNVKLSTASNYISGPVSAKIFCSDKKKPAMVVDIDHTIADVSWFGYVTKPNEKVMPLKNAPEVLQKLSRKYDIVFVTKREEVFLWKTEEWLKMYKFPDAPVFFWDLGDYPLSSVKYKTERIKKLKQIWKNISIGIGDRDTDIESYLANDMKVIKIGKENKTIPNVTFVSNWDEIEDLLLGK
ncbi:MAG: HAD family acid phosphatase [Elusimicrobia bacterium]|nr:HAD family acid phosphatase [Elusimicrobiota bacterium]